MAKCMKLTTIRPKSGELSQTHKDILGCECSFFQAQFKCGPRIFINVPVTNSGSSKTVMTSDVLHYFERESGVAVETENSVYIFKQ